MQIPPKKSQNSEQQILSSTPKGIDRDVQQQAEKATSHAKKLFSYKHKDIGEQIREHSSLTTRQALRAVDKASEKLTSDSLRIVLDVKDLTGSAKLDFAQSNNMMIRLNLNQRSFLELTEEERLNSNANTDAQIMLDFFQNERNQPILDRVEVLAVKAYEDTDPALIEKLFSLFSKCKNLSILNCSVNGNITLPEGLTKLTVLVATGIRPRCSFTLSTDLNNLHLLKFDTIGGTLNLSSGLKNLTKLSIGDVRGTVNCPSDLTSLTELSIGDVHNTAKINYPTDLHRLKKLTYGVIVGSMTFPTGLTSLTDLSFQAGDRSRVTLPNDLHNLHSLHCKYMGGALTIPPGLNKLAVISFDRIGYLATLNLPDLKEFSGLTSVRYGGLYISAVWPKLKELQAIANMHTEDEKKST